MIELGAVLLLEGDVRAAHARLAAGMNALRERADWSGICGALDRMAGAAAVAGHDRRAVRLLGAADSLRDATGSRRRPANQPEFGRWLDGPRQRLRPDVYAAAYAAGRRLNGDEAITAALTLQG
jgi:hypothetical protein